MSLRHLRRNSGFTLIEVMIVVAIVAILAAIALPMYSDSVLKSRRTAAQAFMQDVANRETQLLQDSRRYSASLSDMSLTIPTNVAAAYTITIVANTGPPPSFTITAAPTTAQIKDKCGTMTLSNTGQKTALISGCW